MLLLVLERVCVCVCVCVCVRARWFPRIESLMMDLTHQQKSLGKDLENKKRLKRDQTTCLEVLDCICFEIKIHPEKMVRVLGATDFLTHFIEL